MPILFQNLEREYEAIRPEIDEAIRRVLLRGIFILGPEVERFEKEFAASVGVPFAVGVASGTDALELSLRAAGIGPGDEVIVPVHTAPPTGMAVTLSGARPIFADCGEDFLIEVKDLGPLVTPNTKAIIAVHLYGRACDLDALRSFADAHKLLLIEDCAQAVGAEWKGRRVGSVGDFGCFSFYPTKNIGAYGDGGAVLVKKKEQYDRLRALRFYGAPDKVQSIMPGRNSRLDELQAAILVAKLPHLDAWNEQRRKLARLYRSSIRNPDVRLPEDAPGHVYHLFVVRSRKREALRKALEEKGIATLIHYPLLLNEHPLWKQGVFPRAERFHKEIFSLPLHPFLTEDEVTNIAHILNTA